MPQIKLPPLTASVSDLLDAATALFRMTLAKGMPVALFAMLLAAMPDVYWMTTGKPMDFRHPPLDPKFWALTAAGLVCYQLLAAILMLRQRAMMAGGTHDLRREAALALQRWPMLIVTNLLGGIAIFAGMLLLIGPGVYLLVCFLLLRPVVLFEPADPRRAPQALLRCVRLVRRAWTKVLAAAVIAAIIFLVCVVAAGASLGVIATVAVGLGAQQAAMNAFAAACQLGVQAVALVYFSALWLVLYCAASSSA
ncbi:MAG: hypothetical protein KGL25_03470 [Gammaproteobacteria bacterium]|nr:hypothetical protein [Gammaproteobacteria bacterium]MDE2250447.1 hypothetical protein [Gammaproteobacteria bacterium]